MNGYFLFQQRIFECLFNIIIHIRQWFNILDQEIFNDSLFTGTLLKRLSNLCLYKEFKTMKNTNNILLF